MGCSSESPWIQWVTKAGYVLKSLDQREPECVWMADSEEVEGEKNQLSASLHTGDE